MSIKGKHQVTGLFNEDAGIEHWWYTAVYKLETTYLEELLGYNFQLAIVLYLEIKQL